MIRPPIFVLSSLLAVLLLTTPALLAAEPRLRIASVSTRLDGLACHWRIVVLVEGDTSRLSQLTPEAQVQGANWSTSQHGRRWSFSTSRRKARAFRRG